MVRIFVSLVGNDCFLLPALQVKEFKAHDDYIRSIAVHPSLPYVVVCVLLSPMPLLLYGPVGC